MVFWGRLRHQFFRALQRRSVFATAKVASNRAFFQNIVYFAARRQPSSNRSDSAPPRSRVRPRPPTRSFCVLPTPPCPGGWQISTCRFFHGSEARRGFCVPRRYPVQRRILSQIPRRISDFDLKSGPPTNRDTRSGMAIILADRFEFFSNPHGSPEDNRFSILHSRPDSPEDKRFSIHSSASLFHFPASLTRTPPI